MKHILDVYFHNACIGKLTQDTVNSLSFQYDKNYINQKDAPAIPISMPLRHEIYEGHIPKAFFSGLLPDDIIRQRLARFLGLSEKNSFSLLEAIGGECAGAISLYPEGQKPSNAKVTDIEKLDDNSLEKILDLLKRRPLMAGTDDIRLSLAGAQDKIAVGVIDGDIALIKGNTPTTHILKTIIDGIKDSVHNELFCMRLAKLLKIDVPNVEIRWLKDIPYFLIERYDRKHHSNGNITRLHQEDFCQALGIMPEFKYEREGGPDVQKCLDLIQNCTLQPAADRLYFIKRLIFNYLIGNADAHGKNYSLLYKNKIPSLSPSYDLLCTEIYPNLSKKIAMRIGKEYDPDKIFLRHWYQIVPNTVSAQKSLTKELTKMAKDCLEKAHILKDELYRENIKSSVFDDICNVIKKRAYYIQM